MSSINSVRKLQILYFSKKNKKIKNLKNGEKKWPNIGIYTYYSLRVYCYLWALFAYETGHSFQHCFLQNKYFTFLDLLTLIVLNCTLTAANVWDFKGNCTIAGEYFFHQNITLFNFDELQLKRLLRYCFEIFSNLNAICKIMNITVDFRIFVNVSHSVFLKKH